MSFRATILGCGSSAGVPRLGGPTGKGDWGACNPDDPRNRRRRCSLLIERADETKGWDSEERTTLLIDTSPDCRQQLIDAGVARVDGVTWTHDHADQTHGIDDLRPLVLIQQRRIPVWLHEETAPVLRTRFAYCFEDNPRTGYPAILDVHAMEPGKPLVISGPTGDIEIMPILMEHGPIMSLAFRIGGTDQTSLVYAPDINGVPEASWPLVEGCGIWIVDALRYTPHPSHAHLEQSLGWLERSGARRGILTNLHVDMDYVELDAKTPAHVTPAFDGMQIVFG